MELIGLYYNEAVMNLTRDKFLFAEVSVTRSGVNYPLTAAGMQRGFNKYATTMYSAGSATMNGFQQLWSDFLQYCTIEIIAYRSNNRQVVFKSTIHKEPSVNTLLSIINNIPNAQTAGLFEIDTTLRIYSNINKEIPAIGHIFGYNALYGALSAYTQNGKVAHLGNSPSNWTRFREFTIMAWQRVWGIDITAQYDANPFNWQSTIWFQRDKTKSLYNVPRQSAHIHSGSCGRRVRDGVGNSINAPVNNFVITSTNVIFGNANNTSLPLDTNSNWLNYMFNPSATYSGVFVYGVEYSSYRAIYVKPCAGIDTFVFPKFDNTRYRIEMMISTPGKQPIYRPLPDIGNSIHDFVSNRYRRSHITEVSGRRQLSRKRGSKYKIRDARFYVRDLITGDVSDLSNVRIVIDHAKRGTWEPFLCLIDKDNN